MALRDYAGLAADAPVALRDDAATLREAQFEAWAEGQSRVRRRLLDEGHRFAVEGNGVPFLQAFVVRLGAGVEARVWACPCEWGAAGVCYWAAAGGPPRPADEDTLFAQLAALRGGACACTE